MMPVDSFGALSDLWKAPYLCGIGGIGVSGVALLLLDLGVAVCGSDLRRSVITEMLEIRGVRIAYEPNPARISAASVLVIPAGFPANHPEVLEARKCRVPVLTRTQALARLCSSLGIRTTLCFGTTSRGKLSRFARFLPKSGWCSGAACQDNTPHARIGRTMFVDLDEREFFDHPELWADFPGADVIVSDWQEPSAGYYRPGATLGAFVAMALERPAPGCTVYPVRTTPHALDFRCRMHGSESDCAFEMHRGMLFSSILPEGIRCRGTLVDAGATAAACVWFHARQKPLPHKDIQCIGWFERTGKGRYHDIRMHPVNIRIAIETLIEKAGNAPVTVAVKPFASTLFAYSADIWAEVFEPVGQLWIITPPYEGCTEADCLEFCRRLCERHIPAQCVSLARAQDEARHVRHSLWIGAPDIVALEP